MRERIAQIVGDGSVWRIVWVVAAAIGGVAGASHVSAHPAPAPPPVFDPGPCVTRADLRSQSSVAIHYRVTELSPPLSQTDIPLPDTFSHQFFALRGAVITRGFAPELYSFDAANPAAAELPLWIAGGDVERAQQSSMDLGLGYDLSVVGENAVLQTSLPLQNRWQRITEDDARVPIELDAHSVRWDLRVTKPGLYTVAGYIFSPPFNGWEVRSGLFKVVDGEDIPAAVVDRVQEALFEGQGRRVSLCLDADPGTRLQLFARLEDRPDSAWMAWGDDEPIESGMLQRCFTSPAPGLTGAARIRADLIGPGAQVRSFYSPDTVTLLGSASSCTDSATICCSGAPESAGPTDGGSDPDAAQGGADPGDAQAPSHDGGHESGCAVTTLSQPAEPATLPALMVLGLLAFVARRRRSRDFMCAVSAAWPQVRDSAVSHSRPHSLRKRPLCQPPPGAWY